MPTHSPQPQLPTCFFMVMSSWTRRTHRAEKRNGAGVPSMGWMKQRRRPDARTAVNSRQLRSSRNCRPLGLVVHSPVDALWGRSPRLAARCDSRVIQRLFRLAGVLGIWIRIDERLKRRVRGTKAVLLHVKHCPLEEQRRRLLEIRGWVCLDFRHKRK